MKWLALILLCLNVLCSLSCSRLGQQDLQVLLLSDQNPDAEEAAWIDYNRREDWKTTVRKWSDWQEIVWGDYDVVWIHQTDTLLSQDALAAGAAIRAFTKAGGKVLLSMEAMRLLHPWGMEPVPLEVRSDSIRDEGFGRPLGFHGFKNHIIYDDLHGGVYSWKSDEDHRIRKTGFFGEKVPQYPDAKVLGIEWTYITFHDSTKLVVSYPEGFGQILAVGAYTYFGKPNLNRIELEQFCRNLIYFLGGKSSGAAGFWSYEDRQVARRPRVFPDIPPPEAVPWELSDLSIQETSDPAGNAFVSLAGRRMLIMGEERGGIEEIWSHPFMAARDIQTGIRVGSKVIWLSELPCRLTVSPEMLIREYDWEGHTLRENLTVSFDKPLGLIHYEIPTELAYDGLVFQSFFNARYMWPYDADASGSLFWDYSEEKKALWVSAQSDQLHTWIQFSHPPGQWLAGPYARFDFGEDILSGTNAGEQIQLGAGFFFPAGKIKGRLEILVGASSEGEATLTADLEGLQGKTAGLFTATHEYYRDLLQQKLRIISPDSIFNKGYAWALARTDQFFQTTPGLGTTQMAGFGTTARGWNGRHQISGRPGYAWYFGRDAEWSGMAVNAYGDFTWVKEMLRVFARYQSLNGKIFHELSTSGAVHYDAADATPLFVVLAAHYLKYSNDLQFINELWPSLKRAMDFCYSTDTDGDGLIENTDAGHGWIEGGALFGVHTELYLAGSWAAALEGAAYIADLLGDRHLAQRYQQDMVGVKATLDQTFWSAEQGYFYNGKLRDGGFQEQAAVLQTVPVYLDAITDSTKAIRALLPFAGQQWTADWGIRMIAANNPRFNPRSYHGGMIWPLYGGWAALAEYKTGLYNSAWLHSWSNLINYRYWGKGSVEETLHGNLFQPAGVCSQQCWSESMVLQPLIEGMLGLKPDAPHQGLSLSPRFPIAWDSCSVRNIRMGKMLLHLDWKREANQTLLEVWRSDQEQTGLKLDLTPALPPLTKIEGVTLNGKKVAFQTIIRPESSDVLLERIEITPKEHLQVAIQHTGGIGIVTPLTEPVPGQESSGLRVLRQQEIGETLSLELEGRSGKSYTLDVFSPFQLKVREGWPVRLTGKPNRYRIAFQFPPDNTDFTRVWLTLAPE